MRFSPFSTSAVAFLCFLAANHVIRFGEAVTIQIGSEPAPSLGWMEGICYAPIIDARVGDELVFDLAGHNVFKMSSKWEFETCEFSAATLLGEAGSGKYVYTITEEDAKMGILYLACGVGSHCMGNQKLKVEISSGNNELMDRPTPTSRYQMGLSDKECLKLQYANGPGDSSGLDSESFQVDSHCSEPVKQDDGGYSVTCLSPPATLTPGGVIWEARILHYPFPKDRRVRNGERVWEFVSGDPGEDGFSGLTPVPLNQLYVHHLSGTIVFGQGGEGSRQTDTDTVFPDPYGMVTGNEGDIMVFHLIDIREVDDWISCIECRCKDADGNYLLSGGVNCCSNCTSTAMDSSALDYRMRYNVTYYEIEEDKPVEQVIWLTADQSPALGKNIEYDVPQFDSLPQDQQLVTSDGIKVQRLARVGPFNTIFQEGYFDDNYQGPETVRILRCTSHLHVGGVAMYLKDMETGQMLCYNKATHGTDPERNEGILVDVGVSDFTKPLEIPSDRLVQLVTEYNAEDFHAGVMAIMFLFVDAQETITREKAALTVEMCLLEECDTSVLPSIDSLLSSASKSECINELADHPMCKFGNMCDCETVVNAPESTGCNGIYSSTFGDMEINSVCNEYCGCPNLSTGETSDQIITVSKSSCKDTLADFASCKYGGVCECDEFVNIAGSTGCGGVYKSELGETEVNEVCGAYCGVCTDELVTSNVGVVDLTDPIIELLETQLSSTCQFATEECKYLLSNLYTCAEEAESGETDPVMTVVRDYGQQLAVEFSKLGEANLHVGEVEQEVLACNENADSTATCEDTLPNHPACTFGGICDCKTFVNAPESTGCGGVYKSPFGDVQINDVCAKYCDACEAKAGGADKTYPPGITEAMARDCENKLQKSPACRFGKLCDCEEFANHPDSEGCGGVFKSRFGDTSVDEMCPSYCGSCLEQAAAGIRTPKSSVIIITALSIVSFMLL